LPTRAALLRAILTRDATQTMSRFLSLVFLLVKFEQEDAGQGWNLSVPGS
jgi:hypothetical protein